MSKWRRTSLSLIVIFVPNGGLVAAQAWVPHFIEPLPPVNEFPFFINSMFHPKRVDIAVFPTAMTSSSISCPISVRSKNRRFRLVRGAVF